MRTFQMRPEHLKEIHHCSKFVLNYLGEGVTLRDEILEVLDVP